MNDVLKKIAKKTFIKIGGPELLSIYNHYPKIIFWHGVDNVKFPKLEPENVDVPVFRKQIEYLKKRYDIISMDNFYQRFNNKELKGNEIVLTFDDGYKNNHSVLAPIMYDLNLPFTVFITTKNIDTGDFFVTSLIRLAVFGSSLEKIDIPTMKCIYQIETSDQKRSVADSLSKIIKTEPLPAVKEICSDIINSISTDEYGELKKRHSSLLPLNWDEVKDLNKDLCTIGSHCIDHICCHDKQEQNEVKKQIFESKSIIGSKTGTECRFFAYPNGDHTEFSNECVKNAGYTLGFSTKKVKYNSYDFNRSSMPRQITQNRLDTFKILLNYYGGL